MSLNNFYNRTLGNRYDIDGLYAYQCVDLIKLYLRDEFGVQPASFGNAIDYWTSTHPAIIKKFDKIQSREVRAGDIVVLWGHAGNPYGHIVIALSRSQNGSFSALEQNGATGDGDGKNGDEVRKRQIPVSRIAGLLRPKTAQNSTSPRYYTIKKGDTFWALERAWRMRTGTLQRLNPKLNPRNLQIGQKIKIS